MAKLCVVTVPALADGFRLAGVEVHTASTPELARSTLVELARREDVGLVAVDAELYGALDARLRARLESRLRPIVVPIPGATGAEQRERRSRYVGELIQRAIGLKIDVK